MIEYIHPRKRGIKRREINMKNRKTLRKILAVIFAMLMVSSACMPAFAAGVIYVNAGVNSIYNPYEDIYGGYFKTVGGMAQPATESDWNIHYDPTTEVLTLRDAELIMPLRILGSADIVLLGESIINCTQAPALQSDVNQNFSGSGSLTLICDTYFAINSRVQTRFGRDVTVTASVNADGSGAEEFDSDKVTEYKWVCIQGNDDGSDEPAQKLTLWQKIANFFRSIFDFLFGWIG